MHAMATVIKVTFYVRMEQSLTPGVIDKSPSNPNSPMLSRNKGFHKFGAKRHKRESSASESTDPLLLSYNKNYEGEAPPGEGDDIFETMQDDKKKKQKKRSFLRKVSKLGRIQSNPGDSKARSSDSDDKVQAFATDSFSNAVALGYKTSSTSRAAARSMDDLSAIPETNTNNNNTTGYSPSHSISPPKSRGLKKLKEKKSQTSLQVDQSQVIVKSAPSTPEKLRKKHSSMPNFTVPTQTKVTITPAATIEESDDQGAIPECTVKRRTLDPVKQERHRSLDQNDLQKLVSNVTATIHAKTNVVRASSLNYGDKPNTYTARYRQQHPTTSPLGSQPSFLSSSTMDSQDSLNGVCKLVSLMYLALKLYFLTIK